MKIEDVKSGQKIKIIYGNSIWVAKCIFNDTKNKEIMFSLYWFFGLIPFGVTAIKSYNDYNFKQFTLLNNK